MKKFSGVMIRKEYFEIEVLAETEDEARDLIMDREIEHDPYDIDWEFYEGSIVEITKGVANA